MRKKSASLKREAKVKKSLSQRGKTKTKNDAFEFTLDKIAEYIRTRAYYIWEDMGKPEGKDVEIWRTAEKEVLKRLIKK